MKNSRFQTILGLGAMLLGAGCSGGANSPLPVAVAPASHAVSTHLALGTLGAKAKSAARRAGLVVGPAGFSAMRVSFKRNTIADEGTVIASFAKQYGITTIFLEVSGDDIGMLEAKNSLEVANLNAMFDVATVYIMTGNSSWLASPTTVPSDVTAIVRTIAPAYPRFAGVLYDIEPLPTQEQAYFQLLDTLLAGSRPYAFGTTMLQTSPSWWRLPNRNGTSSPTMLQEAESYTAVAQTYLEMHGGSAASQMTNDVTKSLPQLAKPYWSGADAESQHGNSYLGQTASYLASNLATVATQTSAIAPQLVGISVDEWQDLYGSLQTILPQPTPAPIPQPSAPLIPAPGQHYIGAWVNPDKSGSGPAGVAAFESTIGRKLAYDLHFVGWNKPFISKDETDDLANGRVPLIAWDCGDSDAKVAAGADDAQIKTSAAAAAAYGHPVFVRFMWEMNLSLRPARKGCYDPATDRPGNVLSPTYFIAAWRHIHDIFVAAGATNVIWVWNESGGSPTPAEYYPGNDDVDWIGIDFYNPSSTPFTTMFTPVLNSVAQYQKPIMICETGALPSYQSAYFSQIVNTLESSFPLFKGVSYFDSGSGQSKGDWTLVGSGLAAYASMGQQAAFSAAPQL